MSSKEIRQDILPWRRLIIISSLCYLPAIGMILANFLLMNSLASKMSTQKKDPSPEEVIPIDTKRLNQSLSENTPLVQAYIKSEVQRESKTQADDAAKDALEKIKGDLFGQMAFPVIFAIASIFAAFAVKDVLTEILKEEEKKKLRSELDDKLITEIVPNAIVKHEKKNIERFDRLEAYATWIEYELLKNTEDRIISQLENIKKFPKELTDDYVKSIERVVFRRHLQLYRLSSYFGQNKMKSLLKGDNSYLQSRLVTAVNNKDINTKIADMLEAESQLISNKQASFKFKAENPFERSDSLFQVQLSLSITTLLSVPGNNDLVRELLKFLNEGNDDSLTPEQEEMKKEFEISNRDLPDPPRLKQ